MKTASLKLLLCVTLMFTGTMSIIFDDCEDPISCSCIPEDLFITEVMPIKYDLILTINPPVRTLLGDAVILIDVKKPRQVISLHARGLAVNVQRTNITTLDYMLVYALKHIQYCEEKDILILVFNEVISPGQYYLNIEYTSIFNNNEEKDVYSSIWFEEDQKWMFTNLYTPHAIRAIFPCWDDPAVRATFDILIKHPIDYTVLMNTCVKNTPFKPFNTQWTYFEEMISIPTYFIGIVVISDIRQSEQSEFHTMWHKIDTSGTFTFALNKALTIMAYLFYNIKMDWLNFVPKIDHVVLPSGPMKSMGKPGLVVYREKDISYSSIQGSVLQGQAIDITTLIGYEMARQLFFNSTSSHFNADDTWLNEILASFYSYYIATKIWPEEHRLMELFVVKIIQPALDSDFFIQGKSTMRRTENTDGIDALIYSFLYHKKAFAVIRILQQILTPEIFRSAIARYVHTRTENLWTILEDVHFQKEYNGCTIQEIMNAWLTIEHYPELFCLHKDKDLSCTYNSKDKNEWKIPISFIVQSDIVQSDFLPRSTTNFIWIKPNELKIISGIRTDHFYLIDTELFGYYRVNYNLENWRKISSYLQNNFSHISALNRAKLINDVYYFTIKHELDAGYFVNITSYLHMTTDFIAWYPMFNIFSYMSTYLKLAESANVKQHFSTILDGVLATVGYEINPEELIVMRTPLKLLARKWACKFGNQQCWNAATSQLSWYINPRDGTLDIGSIPEISKNWILCDGLMGANISFWNRIKQEAVKLQNSELLEYLGCSENASIIVHYLDTILQKKDFHQIMTIGQIFYSVMKKHMRKDAVLSFVLDHFFDIKLRFPNTFVGSDLLSDMVMNVYTMEQIDKIHHFVYYSHRSNISESTKFPLEMLISKRKKQLNAVLNKFKIL